MALIRIACSHGFTQPHECPGGREPTTEELITELERRGLASVRTPLSVTITHYPIPPSNT